MPTVEWVNAQDTPTQEVFKGICVRTLWQGKSGRRAVLLEIDPGASWEGIDFHDPGAEEAFVVSGVFNDGIRDYPAGSFIHNPVGSSHVPQSKTGCTLFVFYPEG